MAAAGSLALDHNEYARHRVVACGQRSSRKEAPTIQLACHGHDHEHDHDNDSIDYNLQLPTTTPDA